MMGKCHHVHWWHTKGLFVLEFLDFMSLWECPTSLRAVEAIFAGSFRLYEGNRFVLITTNLF